LRYSSKVGDVGHGFTPGEDFWTRVDIVLNALDNVDARLRDPDNAYRMEKHWSMQGPWVQKGDNTVVVPHESGIYASSADPPERAIAVVLSRTSHTISHTIQWGETSLTGSETSKPNGFFDSLSSSNLEELASKMIREQGEGMALLTARAKRRYYSSLWV
jgi:ubiquitin-activating enzyme E1